MLGGESHTSLSVIMFDLERVKVNQTDYFFRLLYHYNKPKEMERFMQRWFQLLEMYSTKSNFVSFDPPIPLLDRLVPHAVGVLIVPFHNQSLPYHLRNVSIIPLYPFRINYTINAECSREGFELACLYLKATGIQLIGFLNLPPTLYRLISELQEAFPKTKIYGPSSFSSFRAVCQRETLKRM